MKKTSVILALIVLMGTLFRFFGVGENPVSLTWDEAAWGYNAYALGTDGKDEFGRMFPYSYLESFGDYKPPVYAYLSILPVKVFGLTEFATRFASAFLGSLTLLVTFFLAQRIFFSAKNKQLYGLLSVAVLAISPWHIMLSRAAFEANVATFFVVSGMWLFLGAIQEKKWYIIPSSLLFTLSLYTFNTPRVVVPILVCLLALIFRKKLWENKRYTFLAFLLAVLLLLPSMQFFLSPQASLRFKEVNIFSDISVITTANQEVTNDGNVWWSKILHNRRVAYSLLFLKHYFDNLDPQFLFMKGDQNAKFSIQFVGELLLIDSVFFFVGIFFLIRKKEGYWWLLFLWLFIGLIPAGTARETPHALRTEITVPMIQMMIAYGLAVSIGYLRTFRLKYIDGQLVLLFILVAYGMNLGYFFLQYTFMYPKQFSSAWEYGYKESIAYVSSVEKQYDAISVSDVLGRPYIYYLFYMKIDPMEFRKKAVVKRDVFGFVNVSSFGKYYFAQSTLPAGKILYIADPKNVPQDAHLMKTFFLRDGEKVLVAYTL